MKKHHSSPSLWLWGLHACRAALKNPQRDCLRLLLTPTSAHEFSDLKDQKTPRLEVVDPAALSKILPAGAVHQGVALEVLPLPEPSFDKLIHAPEGNLIVLDHVTDPHNVGAILRTAHALNALGVMMTEHHTPPLSGVLAKTASGALDSLPLWKVTNLSRSLEDLKKNGFWTVGLDERSPHFLSREKLPSKLALVMGAEGAGLRRLTQEKCDFLAKLRTNPAFPTLNVSVATALALYELTPRPSLGE